jgi:hypothetical protein
VLPRWKPRSVTWTSGSAPANTTRATARALAGVADRDVADFGRELRDFRRATVTSFNALREDMNDGFRRVCRGFRRTRRSRRVATSAACGGLKPPPAGRLRKADNPSSPAQHRFVKLSLHRTPLHVQDTPTRTLAAVGGSGVG